jgi:hypothetical protein
MSNRTFDFDFPRPKNIERGANMGIILIHLLSLNMIGDQAVINLRTDNRSLSWSGSILSAGKVTTLTKTPAAV